MHLQKLLRITKGNNSYRNGPSPYIFIISICPVDMNKYARFDEIPSMTLKDIKESKPYGRTERTDGTDGRYGRTKWKQYTPPQTQFAGYNYKGKITLIEMAPSPYIFIISICPVDMKKSMQGLMKFHQWLLKLLRNQNLTEGRTTWKQYTHPPTQFGGGV